VAFPQHCEHFSDRPNPWLSNRLNPFHFLLSMFRQAYLLPHFLRNLGAMSEHTWQTWQGENEKREPKNLHFVI
jgi:hypothetical protein